VNSLAPRPEHEVVISEHRRHGTRTGEGSVDLVTDMHIALRIRRITATSGERRSYNRDQ